MNQCSPSLLYLAFERNKWINVRPARRWRRTRYAKNVKHLTKTKAHKNIKAYKKSESTYIKCRHVKKWIPLKMKAYKVLKNWSHAKKWKQVENMKACKKSEST